MNFIFVKTQGKTNQRVHFSILLKSPASSLIINAAPFYQVFFDRGFVSYGPERTAKGFSRPRTISIPRKTKKIEIIVLDYGAPSFDCDFQAPFFGAEVFSGKKVLYRTEDFLSFQEASELLPTSKYSFQRGFIERCDLRNKEKIPCVPYPVIAPTLIEGHPDPCAYRRLSMPLLSLGFFTPFQKITLPNYLSSPSFESINRYDVKKEFLDRIDSSWSELEYAFPSVQTGFIEISAASSSENEVFVAFDEIKPEGGWVYGRSNCNDFIDLLCGPGKIRFLSANPYCFAHLRLISRHPITAQVHLRSLENDSFPSQPKRGGKNLQAIQKAAERTFRQNAVDLFTDCPGRERAGWLCDSYFTGIAEAYYTGKNSIEKAFLENFLLADCDEIPSWMLPMCFPSEHMDGTFIPNWSLWFILELASFSRRSNDVALVQKAKDKVTRLLTGFVAYENEFGLLENLPSWVFVEWSKANDPSFIAGVNFPTNMLYARALEEAAALYEDPHFSAKAAALKETIGKLSFQNGFFVDNAIRSAKNLVPQLDHISETCQYYALSMGMPCNPSFKEKMIRSFGPERTAAFPEVYPSSMFIGHILRLLWLSDIKEDERVLQEAEILFSKMASLTGTLWEKDEPKSSCNHGFASIVGALVAKSLKRLRQ